MIMNIEKLIHSVGRLGDRSLTYGRHVIKSFLTDAAPYGVVVDLGAGLGTDLLLARQVASSTTLTPPPNSLCHRELRTLCREA
ncbi:hypothetical protein AGMMS49982_09790 [Bacteroidia bacterium]|nr:hypothetical protein AGMMS49982_09790 [Bacteroidia bacterium]